MAEPASSELSQLEETQARLNAEGWLEGRYVEFYATRQLRPVEELLIGRYRRKLSGRVLELGCGAGRLSGHLSAVGDVHGLDLSPAMVAHCLRTYPGATFCVGDLRDLTGFATGAYDVVIASFNVLDVVGDRARRRVLDEVRRILSGDGLLIMSSHNRSYALRLSTRIRLLTRLWVGTARRPLRSVRSLPRRLVNRRRLRRLARVEEDYAVLNDQAHDFSVLHYYISRDAQERQMTQQGFQLIECLDLDGRLVKRGESAAHCSELHYVARRAPGVSPAQGKAD